MPGRNTRLYILFTWQALLILQGLQMQLQNLGAAWRGLRQQPVVVKGVVISYNDSTAVIN
jgi:hypothetical protein